MLPARRLDRASGAEESEPPESRVSPTSPVEGDEEEVTATSLGPLATNILNAVMSIRRDARERELEEDQSASLSEPSGRVPLASDIHEVLLPTEEVFGQWLDALQDPAPTPFLATDEQRNH